jgi:hypothetical protein
MEEQNTTTKATGIRDARIRAGRVTADVYINSTKQGQMFNISVYTRYRDPEGNWHSSTNFKANDLPFVEHAVRQAYEHCMHNREKVSYRPPQSEEDKQHTAHQPPKSPELKEQHTGFEMER